MNKLKKIKGAAIIGIGSGVQVEAPLLQRAGCLGNTVLEPGPKVFFPSGNKKDIKELINPMNKTPLEFKNRVKDAEKDRKNLLARLQDEKEGHRLISLLDMTQRGIEFLIDCFDELVNEKIISEHFILYDVQREFLKMQKAFFPENFFSEEKDLERTKNQKYFDFILGNLAKMEKDDLEKISDFIKTLKNG